MSPRKVRLVIDTVRGLPVRVAVQQLEFSPKEAAGPVLKLLKSAIANAEHNDKADVSKLRIAKVVADAGTTLHRWRPRAYGRAAPIRKRTSHITVILSDESPADVHKSQLKGGKKKADKSKKDVKVTVGATPQAAQRKDAKTAEEKKVEKQAEKKVAKEPAKKKDVKDSTNK
jgi:large subunit ribosomal protein L22